MFALIYFDMGRCFYMFEQKNEKCQNFIYKINGQLWSDDIINSLICIFISTLQENVSLEITKIRNFISSLFSKSNLHQIFTVLFEMFYSFYWINLNLEPDFSFKICGFHLYMFIPNSSDHDLFKFNKEQGLQSALPIHALKIDNN